MGVHLAGLWQGRHLVEDSGNDSSAFVLWFSPGVGMFRE